MSDELLNVNIKTCSDSELRTLIRQTLPIFLQACQRLLSKDIESIHKPCDNCDQYETCEKPCEKLKANIPGEYEGSSFLNNTYGDLIYKISDDPDTNNHKSQQFDLRTIDKIRADDVFDLYKRCSIVFSKKQWGVITLRVKEGLTFREIVEIVGGTISSVSGMFYRAEIKMKKYYQRRKSDT